jgi:DNA replication licensing factor MCM7
VGHIPRSITLKCSGEVTRLCKPGDIISVAGLFLPQPRGGFRAMKAGLTADVYIEVITH